MRKIIGALAGIAMSLPVSSAIAGPQQDLKVYLAHQAAKARQCWKATGPTNYCNPHFNVSSQAAVQAIGYMRSLDALVLPCINHDGEACARQLPLIQAARRLGWCSQPTPGLQFENVILWYRCSNKPVVIYKPD